MNIRPSTQQASKSPQFKGSLVRLVVSVMLVLSTVPVLLMGTINYFRSQEMLKTQATDQIQLVVENYMVDISRTQERADRAMDQLIANQSLLADINNLIVDQPNELMRRASRDEAILIMRLVAFDEANESTFNEISVLDPNGKVIVSTNEKREGASYILGRGPSELLGKSGTSVIFNPTPLFSMRMMLFTSRTYTPPTLPGRTYTVIGAGTAPVFQTSLIQAEKFFPNARAFLFNRGNQVVGLTSDNNLTLYENYKSQISALHEIIDQPGGAGSDEYTSWAETPVLAYARWNPAMNFGFVVEAPANYIYDQVQAQNKLNVTIMAISLLVIGLFVWFGSSRMVKPLVLLAENVQAFAGGDWGRRSQVQRKDEIGLLAHSFNRMADELSQLYRSLESKVEERNRQLRTAVEVSNYATATLNRQEILQRTVDLITGRFGYGFAAIYLLDASGTFFNTKAYSGALAGDETGKHIGSRIRTHSLFGSAIASNQITVVESDKLEQHTETLLDGAKSEVIVPISISGQVVGVLDIQHSVEDTFGPDTTTALQIVASQVAGGLNNIAQVENAQVDLKETSLLYRASRLIAQAKDRGSIWEIVRETLLETSYAGMFLAIEDDQLRAFAIADSQQKNNTKPPVIILTASRFEQKFVPGSYLQFQNLGQPSEYFPILSFFHQRGYTSAVLFPVFVDGNLAQVIVLAAREEDRLTSAILQQYLSLVEVVANTEERLNALDAMEANLNELRTLATISQSVSLETNLDSLYRIVLEQVKEATGGELGFFIALLDKENNQINFPFNYERGKLIEVDPMPYGEGLTSIILKTEKPLLLSRNAIQKAANLGVKIVGEPARSWLGVPLTVGGKVFGVMAVEDIDTEGRFTENDLRLLSTIAPQVAISIRNVQLWAQMQQALRAYDQEHYLLNTLLDNIPDSVCFKDEQARYLLGSKSFYAQRGIPYTMDLTGKTDLDLMPNDPQARKIYESELEIVQTGEAKLGQVFEMHTQSGATAWITVDTLPMWDENGMVNGLLSIAHDITDLKNAEQLAQKRAQQLLTAAEIARDASGTLNVEELLEKSINLVRERFGFYHASIFLLDPLGEYAVLRESTGEAGRQLKAAGHRLAVGSQSIVGKATGTGEPVVVDDVTLSANYYANPMLPLTRAELAIPLRIGERTLGALDVQSTTPHAFQIEDINVLRILADQLAIAIFNADLFVETQDNITKHRFLHQITTAAAACTNADDALRTTVEGLRTAFGSDRVAIYLFGQGSNLTIRAFAGYENVDVSREHILLGEGPVGLAALGRHPVLVKDAQTEEQDTGPDAGVRSQLAVPILYTDQTVGVLSIGSLQAAAYNENDQEILGSLGSTLGAILANAQLVSQVRLQVEQQKQLFEITSKIRRSSDIQSIMEISTRELAGVLRARRATIRLMSEETESRTPEAPAGLAGSIPLSITVGRNGGNGNGNGNGHHHGSDQKPQQELDS